MIILTERDSQDFIIKKEVMNTHITQDAADWSSNDKVPMLPFLHHK